MAGAKTRKQPPQRQAKTGNGSTEAVVEAFGKAYPDGTILEAIYKSAPVKQISFIVKEKGKEVVEQPSFEKDGQYIEPPRAAIRAVERRAVILPSGVEAFDSTASLLAEVRRFVHDFVDLGAFEISLLAHYAMFTWVWDAWGSFPYLRFKGEPGTGKTRCLEVMKEVCYRSTDLGVCPSKSSIFRTIDRYRGTVLIDEADYEGDLRSDLIKLLNAGYRADGVVAISVARDDDWMPETFSVGGPKIIANRLEFRDPALETRCITIDTISKDANLRVPTALPAEFRDRGENLRNRLLSWRLENLASLDHSEVGLNGLEGRAKEIGLPLYNISPDERFKANFFRYLEERGRTFRERDPLSIVITALVAIWSQRPREVIPLKELTSRCVAEAKAREIPSWNFTSRRVAGLCRSLEFTTKKWGDGCQILVDTVLLQAKMKRFHIQSDGSDSGDEDTGEATAVQRSSLVFSQSVT